jgi:hypothetical protein
MPVVCRQCLTIFVQGTFQSPVFGAPCELPETQLSTYYDVMKYYLWVRYDLKPDIAAQDPTVEEISVMLQEKLLKFGIKHLFPLLLISAFYKC